MRGKFVFFHIGNNGPFAPHNCLQDISSEYHSQIPDLPPSECFFRHECTHVAARRQPCVFIKNNLGLKHPHLYCHWQAELSKCECQRGPEVDGRLDPGICSNMAIRAAYLHVLFKDFSCCPFLSFKLVQLYAAAVGCWQIFKHS